MTIAVRDFCYPHTSERLSSEINAILEEFEIRMPIEFIITDGAKNMKKMTDFLSEFKFMVCSVHTIQLTVECILNLIRKEIEVIRNYCILFVCQNKSKSPSNTKINFPTNRTTRVHIG